MDRRKFTKNVTKLVSTSVLLSSNQLLNSCSSEEVVPAGTLNLTLSNEVELISGEVFEITWNSNGINLLDLAYKIDQAVNFLTFERDLPASNLKYDFLVPENINGSTMTFRISDSETGKVLAEGAPIDLYFKYLINLAETPELNNVGGLLNVEEGVNNPFIVRKTGENKYVALSRLCTHQGCIIDVNADTSFSCPCHGSAYNKDGEVTQGPAENSLETFRIETIDSQSIEVYYS